jgi:hypothetical protein
MMQQMMLPSSPVFDHLSFEILDRRREASPPARGMPGRDSPSMGVGQKQGIPL